MADGERARDDAAFLNGGGAMGALIRTYDWSATPLGPISAWPQPLRTATSILLRSHVPIMMLWGKDGIMIYNDAYSVFAGRRHPHLLGAKVREGWPEVADFSDNVARVVLAGGTLAYRDQVLTLYRHGHAEQVWMNLDYSPVLDERGEPAGIICILAETTERVAAEGRRQVAEARIVEGEARYRTLFESIESGFCVVEVRLDAPDGRIDYRVVEANPAFYRQTGLSEAILHRWLREAAPDLEEHWYQTYGGVARTGEPVRFEQGSDALGRWFDVYAFRIGEPEQSRVAILFNDISARRLAEQRLRELNETLEQQVAERTAERDRMWDTSPDLMLVIDFEGVFRRVNPAWTTLLGYAPEELVGHHVNEFVLPADHGQTVGAYQLAAGGGRPRMENRYLHKDGTVRWISWAAAPAAGVTYATGRDITADKARQAQLEAAQAHLRQAQKMEAVGQLTGGVAHDFNNLLQALGSCLSMIARRAPEPTVRTLVEAGQQAVDRGATLVRQLMAFSRREGLRPETLDVRDRVEGISELLRRTLREGIRLKIHLEPDLWPVEADPTQLELALLNLAANARDAMPGGGSLTITAANAEIAPGEGDGVNGAFVRLVVSDTGGGMGPQVLERAFEPFFTTKPLGAGTGLGLAQVYGFARQCGGKAAIDSAPGQGTTVTLLLRASTERPTRLVAVPDVPAALAMPGTRVLLVEDEPLVASAVAAALQDVGFDVTCVATADDALSLLQDGARVDVLFTDVVMPGRLNGVDLAREVTRMRPELPVLLTTGYSEDVARAEGVRVLPKPYPLDVLIQAIVEAAGGAFPSEPGGP